MIQGFDITPLFSSTEKVVKNTDDYNSWRQYFYGTMVPKEFLMREGGANVEGVIENVSISPSSLPPVVVSSVVKKSPKRQKKSAKGFGGGELLKPSGHSKSGQVRGNVVGAEIAESAVYQLSKAREVLSKAGGWEEGFRESESPEHLREVCYCLNNALTCRISARERSQVCHSLRYFSSLLGGPFSGSMGTFGSVASGSSEGSSLLGVVFEFDYGDGPTLMYASQEGFSSMYWVGGAVKAPHYDGGSTVDLANKIINIAREYLPSVYDELEGGLGTPSRPRRDFARFSLVTTKGLWTVLLSRDKLRSASSGVGGLYKSFVNLFSALLGPSAVSSESPLTRVEGQKLAAGFALPLDLLVDRVSSLDHRIYAFGADLIFYAIGASLFTYFLSLFISVFGVMSFIFYLAVVFCLLPVMSAWMESSSQWGYSTLGKRIFGIRVFSLDTAEETLGPTFIQALARNMVKYTISPLFCFTGFMWALYSPYGRAWHDLLGDTVVLTKK